MEAVLFNAAEMRALRHLMFHFRSDYTGDVRAELEFCGMSDFEIEVFEEKIKPRHAEADDDP
jgi:hypothetical protein